MPKCKHCKQPYTRTHGIQSWCSVDCGVALAKAKREKARKAETAVMKRAILDTDRAHWIKRAQKSFNAYIRARDAGLPCISCGCPDGKGKRNAGHYRSVGSCAALRFNEKNCHGQCERCNTYLSSNAVKYRIGLIEKIGIEAVEKLEKTNDVRRYSIDYLKRLAEIYSRRTKIKILSVESKYAQKNQC